MAGKGGGGAWKVAYADFVTAMMAFFMVMWITGQSTKVKLSIAHYFNAPSKKSAKFTNEEPPDASAGQSDPLRIGVGSSESGIITLGETGEDNPRRGTDNKGRVPHKPILYTLHDGARQTLGVVVLFADQSAELSDDAKSRLKQLVPEIVGKRQKLEIRGHTTRRPLRPGGPFTDAWQLSYARSLAVAKFLQQRGIEPDRLRLSQAGTYEPQSIGADPAKLAQNARVEVYVLAEVVEDLTGTEKERSARLKDYL